MNNDVPLTFNKFRLELITKENQKLKYVILSSHTSEVICKNAATALNNGDVILFENDIGKEVAIFPIGYRELTVEPYEKSIENAVILV